MGSANVEKVDFVDHRVDVVESPTFKGLCTLYHLYTCDVECNGLPLADFASLEHPKGAKETASTAKAVRGWCWVTWPQCLDMLHSRADDMLEVLYDHEKVWESEKKIVQGNEETLNKLSAHMQNLKKASKLPQQLIDESEALIQNVLSGHHELVRLVDGHMDGATSMGMHRQVPPSVVSEMAQSPIINEQVNHEPQIVDTPRSQDCSCA